MAKNAIEKKILDLLHADNFREVKKENIIDLFTNLNKLDPKVAIEFVKQLGGNVSGSFKAMVDAGKNLFTANEKSEQRCYDLYEKEMDVLLEKLKEAQTDEERDFYMKHIENLRNSAEKKDSEGKDFKMAVFEKTLKYTFFVLLMIGGGFVGQKFFNDPTIFTKFLPPTAKN